MIKIHYTPYIVNNDTVKELEIPESLFLNPIKLSEDIVSEVIAPKNTLIEKSKPEVEPISPMLNLTWARKVKESPKVQIDIKKDNNSDQTVNWDEIKQRQMMAESAGDAKAISRVGAKGLYQIMDPTHQDYIKATGDDGDLFDPEHNTRVRDWYMNWLSNHKIIKNSSNSDFEKARNMLIAYNWGISNLQKYLKGEKELPEETRKYIEKILPKV